MSRFRRDTSSQRAEGKDANNDGNQMNHVDPTEVPAYQEFRASANKVLAARIRQRRPPPERPQLTRRPMEQEHADPMLQCDCCNRIVCDGWKAVHCEHVICVDCMVRTSDELVHCLVCIVMCYEDGQHSACVVCFGCEMLCRCPERLERVAMYGELRYRTTGRKPPEFYKRITRRTVPAAAEKTSVAADIHDAHSRVPQKRVEREGRPSREWLEKLRRLNVRQQKMEERVKYLENCLVRLQRKVEDLAIERPPQALLQQFQEQQQPIGMYQAQFQGNGQGPLMPQTLGLWQTQGAPPPHTGCDAMEQTFAQFPNAYQAGYPASQNEYQQLSLFDAMRQAIGQNVPNDGEGPPRRAIVAVVQVNSQSPESGLLDNFAASVQRNDCREDSSIIIREISGDSEESECREASAAHLLPEPSSSSGDTNPIRILQAPTAVRPQKKDAEASVQMGTLVAELTRLYDKIAALEVDNEKLRDDQRTLQKANAKMREFVKGLQCEQARSRQALPVQIIQPPLTMQTQIQPPQQAMSMHCGPGGASTTAVKVGVDAFVDNSSTQGTMTTSTTQSSDPSKSTEPSEPTNAAQVEEEINIVVHSSPGGEILVNNETTPAKTVAFTQAPAVGDTPWPTYGVPQYKRTTSLPSHSAGQQLSDSELETYKKRVNDIMDWYESCKRREAYLEQTTLAYLRQTLSNSCHFLDYDHPFLWELDKCLKLSSGKTCFRDFRVFSGPIIDVACRGLIRFVVDPLPSSFCVYVEILISAKPKVDQGYVLRVRDPDSRKDFHYQRYKSEDMFGFRGVLTYPGTPCLGFFSIVVQVDHDELPLAFKSGGRLLIQLTKTRYGE